MILDRGLADDQLVSNLSICCALGYQVQHLDFPIGQVERVRGESRRRFFTALFGDGRMHAIRPAKRSHHFTGNRWGKLVYSPVYPRPPLSELTSPHPFTPHPPPPPCPPLPHF